MIESLAYYISKLRKEFVKFCNEKLNEYELTEGLYHYLLYLGKRPDCTLSQIADELHMDHGHTTRSITKLENLGYVIRTIDDHDKRKATLHLSEAGETVFLHLKNLLREWDDVVLKDFSKEEKMHLYHLLQKVDVEKKEETL